MANSFDVLLNILLNRNSAQESKSGIDSLTSSLSEVEKEAAKIEQQAVKFGVQLSKTFKELKAIGYEDAQALKRLNAEFVQGAKGIKAYRDEEKKLKEEAASTVAILQKQQAVLAKQSSVAARTSGILTNFGNQASVGGLAIGGGILAEATAYAKKMEDATEGTREFNAELARIASARGRIDEVLVTEALPLLQTVSKAANIAAGVVEKNPEIISFALKGAGILVAVGTLAKIAGAGFKLKADLTFFAAQELGIKAAQMQLAASTNQLAAAGVKGTGAAVSGGSALVSGGALAGAAPAIGILIAGAFLVELERRGLNKVLGTDQSFGDIGNTAKKLGSLVNPLSLLSFELDALGFDEASQKVRFFNNGLFGLNPAIDEVTKSLAELGSVAEDEAKGVEILKGLAEDQAKAERKLADDRQKILTDATRDIAAADRSLEGSLSNIAQSLTSNIKKINADLKDTLADLAASFAEANIQAEQEYQKEREDIIASGNEEVARIQEQAKKDLEKLEQEHARNVQGLTNARDALGLIDEQQSYEDRKNEIEENAQDAIEQARANTQAQLEEAARNYEEQRQLRLAEYEKQKAEEEARAKEAIVEARAKAAEEKAEAEKKNVEEKQEIERRRQEALADLKTQFDNEERERVIAAGIAIADLGNALNAELELRRRYYEIFNAELEAAINSASTASTSPSTALSSVSSKGYSGSRTPGSLGVLRSSVGSKLMATSSKNSGESVVWNDYRKFDADVSMSTRNAIKQDTLDAINKAMERARR